MAMIQLLIKENKFIVDYTNGVSVGKHQLRGMRMNENKTKQNKQNQSPSSPTKVTQDTQKEMKMR